MSLDNFIFDLDDTLCHCHIYYLKLRETFARSESVRTGYSEEFCFNLLCSIDNQFMTLPGAFHRERFPRSFASTAATLDIMRGTPPNAKIQKAAYTMGEGVFDAPYQLFNDSFDTLKLLQSHQKKLFLFTKGDVEVQLRKIRLHKLSRFFSASNIYIVDRKTPEKVNEIINKHKLEKDKTVVIGDSEKDDIVSAHEAGVNSFHIIRGFPQNYSKHATWVASDLTPLHSLLL